MSGICEEWGWWINDLEIRESSTLPPPTYFSHRVLAVVRFNEARRGTRAEEELWHRYLGEEECWNIATICVSIEGDR